MPHDTPLPEQPPPANRPRWRRFWPVLLILLGFALFVALGGPRWLSFEALAENRADLLGFVADWGLAAFAVYIVLYALSVAFSLPGAIWLTIGGGFLFGAIGGGLAAVVGATIGAIAIFVAARHAFADLLRARAGPWLQRFEAGFNKDALSYLFALRLVPVFPFFIVNLAPAFLGVRLRDYAIATFFGIMPGTFVYAWLGDGVGAVIDEGEVPDLSIIFNPQVIGPLIGLAGLALIPVVWRRFKGDPAPPPPAEDRG